MKVIPKPERTPAPVHVDGAQGVSASSLVAEPDGAPTCAMRLFELAPGGRTPHHTHDWEHVIYVVEGEGLVATGKEEFELAAGDTALVDPGEEHHFSNNGKAPFRFVCVVPLRGDAQ